MTTLYREACVSVSQRILCCRRWTTNVVWWKNLLRKPLV